MNQPSTRQRVTMAQIADAAGVSRITVSNVLNGRTRGAWKSSAAQVNRIRALARQMGYRPNAAAKAIAHGRFHSIAMVTRSKIGGQQQSLTAGVVKAARGYDLNLLYAELADEEQIAQEGAGLRMLRELSVDGLLVHYGRNIPDRFREVVANYGVPAVWVHTKGEMNCVYPDETQGASFAIQNLLDRGHRRIAYVKPIEHLDIPSYATPHYSEADREAGYRAAMKQLGLTPRVIDPDEIVERGPKLLHHSLAEWVGQTTDVDALLCYDAKTGTAMHVSSLMSRPLEVACFYHRSRIDGLLQGPSIILVPMQQMGKCGVEMLQGMTLGGNSQVESAVVPYTQTRFPLDGL